MATSRSGVTRRGETNIPLVQPSKLVLALFIPLASSFKVVLVVKSAADCISARYSLRNILPLHATSPELDDECSILGPAHPQLSSRRKLTR